MTTTRKRIGVWGYRSIGAKIPGRYSHTPTPPYSLTRPRRASGQAMTEIALIIPLLLMLGAGAMFVIYVCSQGIKVQQAANLAARIQGQERIAGGLNTASIEGDDGVYLGLGGNEGIPGSTSGVYGEIQAAVKQFFSPSEQDPMHLSTPPPIYGQAGNTDAVTVYRYIYPPSNMFGLNLQPLTLGATAYGGEDPRAYGLPRWGSTTPSGATDQFWRQKDGQGNFLNLPKGKG